VGPYQSLGYRATLSGWYDVEVHLTSPGAGAYGLRISKTP
jgi:hypothetical protein